LRAAPILGRYHPSMTAWTSAIHRLP